MVQLIIYIIIIYIFIIYIIFNKTINKSDKTINKSAQGIKKQKVLQREMQAKAIQTELNANEDSTIKVLQQRKLKNITT